MSIKSITSKIALDLVVAASLVGSITSASAQGYWHHRHHRYWRRQVPYVVGPVWPAPQPGWYWHSHAWYYNHPYGWRMAHPYHPGPRGGIYYLQF